MRNPKPSDHEAPTAAAELGVAAAATLPGLYRLAAWLSPAYPVGAFSYSSGLEWAIEAGDIDGPVTMQAWLSMMLSHGSGFCDAVLFRHAYEATSLAEDDALRDVAELGCALALSKERHLETTAQGTAFLLATDAAWPPCAALQRLARIWDGAVAYPIAVAVTCAGHGVALEFSLHSYVQALAANWISAGVRLIPLGQTDGQRLLVALEPTVASCMQRALITPLDEIGSATFRADLASMRHETQYTRLFRS